MEKQYSVKLTKIRSNHTIFRTDIILGTAHYLPKQGECFRMYGKGLEIKGSVRIVVTTPIQNVEQIGNEYQFQTLNSMYKLEVLGENNFGSDPHSRISDSDTNSVALQAVS